MKKLLSKLGGDKDESKYLRAELVLGKSAIVVGDKFGDLVLETLGKVYIKSGRNYKLLNDVFDLLDLNIKSKDKDEEKIIILSLEQNIRDLNYPGEGYFIFDSHNEILYISVKGQYIALVNASEFNSDKYVKKSGDTMTGTLSLTVLDKVPLIVKSSKLIENLNSQYIDGYSSDLLAKVRVDESIFGKWLFTNDCRADKKWTFNDNVFFNKDIVSTGSISTPVFSSGFTGTGWRLDGTTNTLTIDNLVVRKLMRVYEMVINQIRATNGSLWVSNAGSCSDAILLKSLKIEEIIPTDFSDIESVKEGLMFIPIDVYQIDPEGNKHYVNNNRIPIDGESLSTNQDFGQQTTFYDFKYIYKITSKDILLKKLKEGSIDDLYDVDKVINNYTEAITVSDIFTDSDLNNIIDKTPYFTAYIENPTNGTPKAVDIKIYYKYFGCKVVDDEPNYNYWIVKFEENDYPPFEVGDILRCQKMIDYKSIKYYDALVLKKFTGRTFLILKACSVFDIYSDITYDSEGNIVLVEKLNTRQYARKNLSDPETWEEEQLLGNPCKGDDLVQIGNIQDRDRLGAIYLTSSDDQSPYIDVVGKINRPDYAVIYKELDFIMYNGYYVSERPSEISLGEFRVYSDNSIEEAKINDSEELYTLLNLYGYVEPNSLCLVRKGLDGKYLYIYTKTTKVRLGKLSGIYDEILKNHQPYGYGLYADNVFLTGEFYLNNGKSIASFADDIALLSGEILNIDLEGLKNEISDSVSTMITDAVEGIENKFSETEEDEDGNIISAGFAGLFTFDYTDGGTEVEELKKKKGLAIMGDSIVFYTSKDGKFNFNEPTALMTDGMINAELINVSLLSFEKLIGNSTVISLVVDTIRIYIGDVVKENGAEMLNRPNFFIYEGISLGALPQPSTNLNMECGKNYQNGGRIILGDIIVSNLGNIYRIVQKCENEQVWWDATSYDGNIETLNESYFTQDKVDIGINFILIEPMAEVGGLSKTNYVELVAKDKEEKYKVMSVNGNNLGENILYYPSGYVMNAKILWTNSTKTGVKGCVEYFFLDNVIKEDTLLGLGDDYIVSTYMGGNPTGLPQNGLIKRINYFTGSKNFSIGWRTTVANLTTLVLWKDAMPSNIDTITTAENLYLIYEYLEALSEDVALNPSNGAFGTTYSSIVSNIIKLYLKPTVTTKNTLGKGTSSSLIWYKDSKNSRSSYDVNGWYRYDTTLEDFIEDRITLGHINYEAVSQNDIDKIENSRYKEEILHIISWNYINANTGWFIVEYVGNQQSPKQLRFLVTYGVYDGPTNEGDNADITQPKLP